MENTEELDKSFWIDKRRVPDKDGKIKGNVYAGYDGRIKVSLGKPYSEHLGGYRMDFKTVISQHVHEKLVGKKITRIRDQFSSEPSTNDYTNFKKTVTSYSLEGLLKRYDAVIDDYLFIMDDERTPKEKVIFVRWDNNFGDIQSTGNGAKMGKNMSMSFNFFVGYYNGQTMFDIDYKPFNTHYDPVVIKYKRIPWTPVREEFFERVYNNFWTLKDKLDAFFVSIEPTTIDAHIKEFKMLS